MTRSMPLERLSKIPNYQQYSKSSINGVSEIGASRVLYIICQQEVPSYFTYFYLYLVLSRRRLDYSVLAVYVRARRHAERAQIGGPGT